MSNITITKEEIEAIYPKVAEIIADALACDEEEVKPDSSLINDLGAESIDFLDFVFRLERTFKVKIPRGKIVEDARGSLTEAEFENGGVVTDAGVAQLKAYLDEVPADRFPDNAQVGRHRQAVHGRNLLQDGDPPAEGRGARGLRPAVRCLDGHVTSFPCILVCRPDHFGGAGA